MNAAALDRTWVEVRVVAITPPDLNLLATFKPSVPDPDPEWPELLKVDKAPPSSAPAARYDPEARDEWALHFRIPALTIERAERWARAECERIGLDVLASRPYIATDIRLP